MFFCIHRDCMSRATKIAQCSVPAVLSVLNSCQDHRLHSSDELVLHTHCILTQQWSVFIIICDFKSFWFVKETPMCTIYVLQWKCLRKLQIFLLSAYPKIISSKIKHWKKKVIKETKCCINRARPSVYSYCSFLCTLNFSTRGSVFKRHRLETPELLYLIDDCVLSPSFPRIFLYLADFEILPVSLGLDFENRKHALPQFSLSSTKQLVKKGKKHWRKQLSRSISLQLHCADTSGSIKWRDFRSAFFLWEQNVVLLFCARVLGLSGAISLSQSPLPWV